MTGEGPVDVEGLAAEVMSRLEAAVKPGAGGEGRVVHSYRQPGSSAWPCRTCGGPPAMPFGS